MKSSAIIFFTLLMLGCAQNQEKAITYYPNNSDEHIIIEEGDDYKRFDTVSFFLSPDVGINKADIKSKIINFADYVGERNAVLVVENRPESVLKIHSGTNCKFKINNNDYSFLFVINQTGECISGSFGLYSSASRTFDLINKMIERKEICYAESAENNFIELVEKAGGQEKDSIISLGAGLIRILIGSGLIDCNFR